MGQQSESLAHFDAVLEERAAGLVATNARRASNRTKACSSDRTQTAKPQRKAKTVRQKPSRVIAATPKLDAKPVKVAKTAAAKPVKAKTKAKAAVVKPVATPAPVSKSMPERSEPVTQAKVAAPTVPAPISEAAPKPAPVEKAVVTTAKPTRRKRRRRTRLKRQNRLKSPWFQARQQQTWPSHPPLPRHLNRPNRPEQSRPPNGPAPRPCRPLCPLP